MTAYNRCDSRGDAIPRFTTLLWNHRIQFQWSLVLDIWMLTYHWSKGYLTNSNARQYFPRIPELCGDIYWIKSALHFFQRAALPNYAHWQVIVNSMTSIWRAWPNLMCRLAYIHKPNDIRKKADLQRNADWLMSVHSLTLSQTECSS